MCDISNETLPKHTDQESVPHIYHTLRNPHMLNFTGNLAVLLSKINCITIQMFSKPALVSRICRGFITTKEIINDTSPAIFQLENIN